MSAPDCPDVSAVDQLDQELRDLAKSLGVDPDAPDVVVQFAAALLLAILRLVSLGQSQPTKSRRKPTWKAGLYEELYRDVNQTMARPELFDQRRNCTSPRRQKRAMVEVHAAVA